MHIFVRDLKVQMLIGIYPHEHQAPQEVIVNIDAIIDEPADWRNDAMDDWVSYESFADAVHEQVAEGHVNLLETVAHRLAETLLADQRIRSIAIRLEKTAAVAGTRSVGIEYKQDNMSA